jgi:hypothetical protein
LEFGRAEHAGDRRSGAGFSAFQLGFSLQEDFSPTFFGFANSQASVLKTRRIRRVSKTAA